MPDRSSLRGLSDTSRAASISAQTALPCSCVRAPQRSATCSTMCRPWPPGMPRCGAGWRMGSAVVPSYTSMRRRSVAVRTSSWQPPACSAALVSSSDTRSRASSAVSVPSQPQSRRAWRVKSRPLATGPGTPFRMSRRRCPRKGPVLTGSPASGPMVSTAASHPHIATRPCQFKGRPASGHWPCEAAGRGGGVRPRFRRRAGRGGGRGLAVRGATRSGGPRPARAG